MSTISKDYCSICKNQTNHDLLFTKRISNRLEDDLNWYEDYQIIQCRGCENLQFRKIYGDDTMYSHYHDYEDYYEDKKYYPSFIIGHSNNKYSFAIPEKIRVVYFETLEALKSKCYLLTAVGLRAVIEAICLEQNIGGRNLELKINNLTKNKLITEKDAYRLHSIRFLGNDSVHEMEVPHEKK